MTELEKHKKLNFLFYKKCRNHYLRFRSPYLSLIDLDVVPRSFSYLFNII